MSSTWSPPAPPYSPHSEPPLSDLTANAAITSENGGPPPPAPIPEEPCSPIRALHLAVASKQYDVVQLLIDSGMVTANTLSCWGNTPLYTAIMSHDLVMAKQLVSVGADVNAWSMQHCCAATRRVLYEPLYPCDCPHFGHEQVLLAAFEEQGTSNIEKLVKNLRGDTLIFAVRTPLMAAASTGQIALVKLLLEQYSAAHERVAPDGQTALRLAASGKHREVVAILPSLRAGAFQRLRYRSRIAVRRIKAITHQLYRVGKFFLYSVPKFFLWTIPKYTWKNGRHISKFFFYHLPKFVFYDFPKFLICDVEWKYLIKEILRSIKRLSVGIFDLLVVTLKQVKVAFDRLLSFLHTVAMAIWTFLKNVTLQDVWNALVDLAHSIFVDLPRAIWIGLIRALYHVLRDYLGLIMDFGRFLFRLATYVPKQILNILREIAAVIIRLSKEIWLLINPKALMA